MLGGYHHATWLNNLCKELSDAGFKKEARSVHTFVNTTPNEDDAAAAMRDLVTKVRRLREAQAARDRFVLNTAAETVLVMSEQDDIEELFQLDVMEAADQAADHLANLAHLESARRKLVNDFGGQTGVDDLASDRISERIDARMSRHAARLSLLGARAGGMDLAQYKREVIQPMRDVVREQFGALDEGIQKRLKEISDL